MLRRALLLSLISGCATTTPPPPKAELTATGRLEDDRATEGEIGRFLVTVRNGSADFVVLREIVPVDSASAPASWQVGLAGSLDYEEGTDSFLYERRAKGTTAPLFNRGLLAPGESISFRTRLRLLDLPRTFTLRYYAYDATELSRRVYFEKRGERETRFVRLFGADLEKKLAEADRKEAASLRTVVFPYAEQVAVRPLERTVELDGPVRKREFTLEQARAKAGVAADDEHTFYDGLGLWAIRSGDRAWLVSAARLIELPRTRNLTAVFHLLDVIEHPKFEVEFLKETKTLFADDYPLVADGRRFLAFVPRSDLLEFLEKVRGFGLILDAQSAEGGARLVVTR